MKRILILLIAIFLFQSGFSQSRYYLRYDTVYIEKGGGNGELVLRNGTRDSIGGLLINIGGGLTAFKKARALNDSTFIIGLDTLVIKGGVKGGSALDTTSLSNRIELRVKYSDTALMLFPYLRKTDTTSLSLRIDQRVKYSDTASMLSTYLRKTDTASLSARIDLRMKYTDTSSLSDRIDTKQPIGNYITGLNGDGSATGPGLANFVLSATSVTPGSYTNADITIDSKGRITAASNGSGGGTDNSNVGSGFRILKPATQEIKTLFPGAFMILDSLSNPDGITATVDTNTVTGLSEHYLRRKDTLTLSNRINQKVDSLHTYTAVDPASDSIYSYKNGDSTLVGLIPKGGGSSSVTTDITLTGDGSPGDPLGADTSAGKIATKTDLLSKLNISDTSGMLTPYINMAGYALTKSGQIVLLDSATLFQTALRRKDSTLYTTVPRFMDSVNNRLMTIYHRNDSVFSVSNGVETFRFKINQVNLGGIFANAQNTIYTAIVRPTLSGSSVLWEVLNDGNHTNYGFSDFVEGTSTGFTLYQPTARRLHTILIAPDESMSGNGVTAGASYQTDKAVVTVNYDMGNQGGQLRGNGTATLTKVDNMTSWTVTYSPTTGAVFLTYPATPPIVESGLICQYLGLNNWHLRNIASGLGGANFGFQILDAGGGAVTDTLQSTDYININSRLKGGNRTVNGISGSSLPGSVLYNGGFSNFWMIAVVERDTLAPGPITNISVTPSSTQLALNWDDATLATGYVVDRSTLPHSSFVNVYTGATSAFTDTGLTNGVTYYYRIRSTAAGSRFGGYFKASGVPN